MKNKITYEKFYRTKDQFIATTLFALGFKIESTEWENNQCYFLFSRESKCREIVDKYYCDALKTSPRLLFDSLKAIKSIIYS